ncbi:MAG: hypothetical protein M3419_01470 [Actinomycetota bacterium]|nr:hypothetical protein [Actinomycetota bacterium]
MPLDYDRPGGVKTTLALAKRPASGRPNRRIGTLFVNPGGPGGASRDFVLAAAALLGPQVRARFDIVGIDPRGIGGSTPVRCTFTKRASCPAFAFPYNQQQTRRVLGFNARLRGACAQRGSPIDLGNGTTFSYADLIALSLGPMYDRSGYRPPCAASSFCTVSRSATAGSRRPLMPGG